MHLNATVDYLRNKWKEEGILPPALHVTLGSITAHAIDELSFEKSWRLLSEISFREVPGLIAASAPGHKGCFQYYEHTPSKKTLCVQAGRVHGYEGIAAREAVKPVLAHKILGTSRFVLTNAAGSLRKEMDSGSVMVISDHVNLTGQNPLVGSIPKGPDQNPLGPRFPDMTGAYDPAMAEGLARGLKAEKFEVHKGVYLGLLGPSFETPAEVRLFASWGLDAVGMSTVWEAIALRHAGAKLAGVSLVTNLCAGILDRPLDHEEFEASMKNSATRFAKALFDFAAQEFIKNG